MTIKSGTFAEACYNQNTITELEEVLESEADQADTKTWGITEDEYFEQIKLALNELISDATSTFAMFPVETINTEDDTREVQIFCLAEELEEGYYNDSDEWIGDDTDGGDCRRFQWWDGNNTKSVACDSSEVEYADLVMIKTIRETADSSPYESYRTYFRDTRDGMIYVSESDNVEQNTIPRISQATEEEIELLKK